MESLCQDVRYALRSLGASPRFAAVVVLTLAVGIAANTVIFSVAQGVLFRPLAYPDADRLLYISRAYPGYPQGGGNFSYPMYLDMRAQATAFDAIAGYQGYGALALTGGDEPVRVAMNYITPSYFTLLGARASLGRLFRPDEDRAGDADSVVVLSDHFWRRRFAADPAVVGRTIHLNERPFTVVGIAAPEFRDALNEQEHGEETDAWMPLGLAHAMTGFSSLDDRAGAILWGVGRLKPAATLQQARADLDAIQSRAAAAFPGSDSGFGLVARPLKDQLVGVFYAPGKILLVGSLALLLISCANVANLLLARLLARRRELAVRSALGASTSRLSRHLLLENAVMTVVAGAAGLCLAELGMCAIRPWAAVHLPPVVRLQAGGWVFLASVGVSIVTGALFGVVPALLGSRVDLRDALSLAGREGSSLSRRRGQRILVVAEVGLALAILIGAGLLVKSFERLASTPLRFETHNLLTLRLELRSARYTAPEARARFGRALVEKLETLPGVRSATLWGPSMLGRATWVYIAYPEGGSAEDPAARLMMGRHSVNPGALSNLGIPLVRGRDISWRDSANSPAIAVISESVARKLWPGQEALGKRMRSTSGYTPWVTVVGVARDAVHGQRFDLVDASNGISPLGLGPQYDVYFPYTQRPNPGVTVALRVSADPESVSRALKAAVLSLDPALPVFDLAMLDERLSAQVAPVATLAAICSIYAALAVFLAAFGLFAVLAHDVSQRFHEMGIRMALGALPRNVLALILREGLALTSAGLLLGTLSAAGLTQAMQNLLYGVSPLDSGVFAGLALLLACVASLACWLPARRAMRLDAMDVLRRE
ncbi:MAG TPA: ABC transporter permease [Candidatus Acidoferrales bacterium]|nr:ABC transporter permease [Candidatus Acidoferrales bacterium]